ncbi:MAG TPA: hypothetical protein VI756_02870 [Blastocatellia bacterium]
MWFQVTSIGFNLISATCSNTARFWSPTTRDFVLVGYDADRQPASLEPYRLAPSESGFWAAAVHPHKMAQIHEERLTEYLKRVMLHAAPLAPPQDLAWFPASYARQPRVRIESVDLPAPAARAPQAVAARGWSGTMSFPNVTPRPAGANVREVATKPIL